jgi:signal transduction histidine kinase
MASAARAMNGGALDQRLPVAPAADELQDLSCAFNSLLDRIQNLFEKQGRFTADASHQLRTPLTAILGQIEVALRRDRSVEEYRQALASMQKQALHLRRIVEALLFLAHADAESRHRDLERVVLNTWLHEHLRSWSGHARSADIRIDNASDAPLHVEVQPSLLGEVVDLLLDNACKYSPPGSPIAVRLVREDSRAMLVVEDKGFGISPEDLPHICDPFFRSDDTRRRGVAGLGLGLAIAKRLVEAFGGSLVIASEVGVGSKFRVSFPETSS